MIEPKISQNQGINALLKATTDLHGHLGPFLAIGVRLGLIGLRELKAKQGDTQMHVTVKLKYAVPFSCILDGIQTTTKCTVGNQRLTWRESKEIEALFQLKNSRRQVEVKMNPAVIQELIRKLEGKSPFGEEARRLALDIVSRPENELFSVKRK